MVRGEHRDRAVVLGAFDAPVPVRAGDEPSLAVARVAVGIAGRVAELRYPQARDPAQNPVVWDIAPEQIAAVAEPNRPLGPAAIGIKRFELRRAVDELAALLLEMLVKRPRTRHAAL